MPASGEIRHPFPSPPAEGEVIEVPAQSAACVEIPPVTRKAPVVEDVVAVLLVIVTGDPVVVTPVPFGVSVIFVLLPPAEIVIAPEPVMFPTLVKF